MPFWVIPSAVWSFSTPAVVLLLMWGAVLGNAWVAATAVMAHLYSAGLAGWDEDEDLRQRFGAAWTAYRRGVRGWAPRWRPWHAPDEAPARLYVSQRCAMCSEVGQWFQQRHARSLLIVAAEDHPSRSLTRITYDPADGSAAATGITAVARALEHVHIGWATLAFFLRLPIICPLVQLLTDASGGEPRTIPRQKSIAP